MIGGNDSGLGRVVCTGERNIQLSTEMKSTHEKVAAGLRNRRFSFFSGLLRSLRRPVRLLDCGGTLEFWETTGKTALLELDVEVTILNLFELKEPAPRIKWHVGDVRDLSRFRNGEFDVVFSNAVINLMPTGDDQRRMSEEMMRVGKRIFVQSPNRYFPLDWRTLVPFFHLLNPRIQAWCFSHFGVGRYRRVRDPAKAYVLATRVRDLSAREMRELFPECSIFRERFCGLTKSLTAYRGWSVAGDERTGHAALLDDGLPNART
jgi:hypothetical protein